jgi:hypothetical protein
MLHLHIVMLQQVIVRKRPLGIWNLENIIKLNCLHQIIHFQFCMYFNTQMCHFNFEPLLQIFEQ